MRFLAALVALIALLFAPAYAQGEGPNQRGRQNSGVSENGCSPGTYSIINAPDGSALTILFDDFSIVSSEANVARKYCNLQIPLNLPAGHTLGVYRVDYRGFSRLSSRQSANLSVDYALGPRNNGRRFHRSVRGAHDGEFLFRENIGAGLMRRVGCGEAAVLNVAATLDLQTNSQPEEAMIALDSADGTARGGLVYHFNLRRCER